MAVAQGIAEVRPSSGPSPFIAFGVIVPFCEAILCNSGFKALGGHAIFDTTIVIGTVISAAAGPNVDANEAKKLR